MFRGGDGATSEMINLGDVPTDYHTPSETAIWVDIFDPINNPSFKPSQLKPIPMFMQRSPTLPLERKCPPTAIDAYLQTPPPLQSRGSNTCVACPTPRGSAASIARPMTPCLTASRPATPRPTSSRPTTPRPLTPNPPSSRPTTPGTNAAPPPTPPQDLDYVGPLVGPFESRRQPFAVVREEPLKRPSSRLASTRRVEADWSAYQTSPAQAAEQSPYPQPLSLARVGSLQSLRRLSQPQRVVRSVPPQSSEYLERYRPVMTPGSRKPPPLAEPVPSPAAPVLSTEQAGEAKHGKGTDDNETGRGNSEGRDWEKMKHVGAELRRFFIGR